MEHIIETERLLLRELTMEDLDFVAEMMADPDVMRHYPKVLSREESRDWLEKQMRRYIADGHGLWLVTLQATGDPVGQVGILRQIVDGDEEPEIGYLIHRPYWRQGFASEAAIACREYAFAVLEVPYVISLIQPVNLPSQGVADKLGMSRGKTTKYKGLEHIVYYVTNPNDEVGSPRRRESSEGEPPPEN